MCGLAGRWRPRYSEHSGFYRHQPEVRAACLSVRSSSLSATCTPLRASASKELLRHFDCQGDRSMDHIANEANSEVDIGSGSPLSYRDRGGTRF